MVLWTKVRSTHVKAWELSIMSTDVPFHDLSHKKVKRDLCIYLFLDFSVAIIIVKHHVKSVYNDYASGLAFLEKKHEFNKGC